MVGLLRFTHTPFPVKRFSAQSLGLELYCGDTEEVKSGRGCGAAGHGGEQ